MGQKWSLFVRIFYCHKKKHKITTFQSLCLNWVSNNTNKTYQSPFLRNFRFVKILHLQIGVKQNPIFTVVILIKNILRWGNVYDTREATIFKYVFLFQYINTFSETASMVSKNIIVPKSVILLFLIANLYFLLQKKKNILFSPTNILTYVEHYLWIT